MKLFRFFQKDVSVRPPYPLAVELTSFDKGGLEKVVLDIALRLNPELFRPVIVCEKGGYLGEKALQKGLKVFVLDGFGRERKYKSILKEQKIAISNSHFSRYGYALFRELGIPNITFIHNVYAFLPDNILDNLKKDDRYVHTYISVSQNATRYATRRLGLDANKFITIPNGLIVSEHEKRLQNAPRIFRKDFGIAENDYVFLNVASYNLHKGHYLMADAMKKILKIRGDIKIICLGNIIYPPHAEELRKYLNDNGLENHILMPGYYPNVESFYQISDAFLLPSFIEGWSIAMNEAMFYEKPMILTDTGASGEVIENDDIGILIRNEYGDILNLHSALLDSIAYHQRQFQTSGQLADAMLNFADNRNHWREAGKKGKEKLLRNYDFDHIVRQYEKVFTAVAEGKNVYSEVALQ